MINTLSNVNLASDVDVLTGTLYGEIRGGTLESQQNVAQVILNRHLASKVPVHQVCLAPNQFSCWNSNDPNPAKILAAPVNDSLIWNRLKQIAVVALSGANPDRVAGARNYYASWMKVAPAWARPPAVITLRDGFHIFVKAG